MDIAGGMKSVLNDKVDVKGDRPLWGLWPAGVDKSRAKAPGRRRVQADYVASRPGRVTVLRE